MIKNKNEPQEQGKNPSLTHSKNMQDLPVCLYTTQQTFKPAFTFTLILSWNLMTIIPDALLLVLMVRFIFQFVLLNHRDFAPSKHEQKTGEKYQQKDQLIS